VRHYFRQAEWQVRPHASSQPGSMAPDRVTRIPLPPYRMAIHPQTTRKSDLKMSPTPLSVYNERTPPNHLFFTSSLPSSRSQFARITALLFLFEFAVSFNLSILSTLLIFVFLTIYFKIRVNHIKVIHLLLIHVHFQVHANVFL